MIRLPLKLDMDRYWWIVRDTGGIHEVFRIRRDDDSAEDAMREIFIALETAQSARLLVDGSEHLQAVAAEAFRTLEVARKALTCYRADDPRQMDREAIAAIDVVLAKAHGEGQ